MKNYLVDYLIGAALNINYLHSSSPRFALTLLNTSFLAVPQNIGVDLLPVT